MAAKIIKPGDAKAIKDALRVLAEPGVIDSVSIPSIGSRRGRSVPDPLSVAH